MATISELGGLGWRPGKAPASQLVAEDELRLSPKVAGAGFVVAGLLLLFGVDQSLQRMELLIFVLFLDACGLAVWLLADWRPTLGRWVAIGGASGLLTGALLWFARSELLLLGVVPVVLAMALLSFSAAALVALVQSAGWLAITLWGAGPLASAELTTLILAHGLLVGLLYAIHEPVRQQSAWSLSHFQRAQRLLDEARNRQAELAQALDDLAHANRQLTLLNEKLAGLRLLAEEAQNAKALFVAKVSHEFRAPLNIIISLIDLLVETPEVYGQTLPALLLEDLQIVHRNCEHLSTMINDVLDLSQAEAGQLVLRRTWVTLPEMVLGATELIRPLAEKKKLQLALELPPALPPAYCDPHRTRQVILNLVSNAVRFTEQGAITLAVQVEARQLVVSVRDTGAGIAPEHADRIFEAFFQGGDGARASQGYGLGLSISKKFVELQGGKMWFTSSVGAGSSFFFTLPVAPPAAPRGGPAQWIHPEWLWRTRPQRALPSLPHRPRLVIWDEQGDLQPLLVHHLDAIEFVVTRSLAETNAALAECPAHAVVINALADHERLLEEVRLAAPDTPIFACAYQAPLRRAQAAGAVNYLIKPVLNSVLQEAVRALDCPLPRVLVVDDDPDFRQLLPRMLQTCDAVGSVEVAATAAEALAALDAAPPDLLLLDVVLPDQSGWQILAHKNQDQRLQVIPTIILSAQDPNDEPVTSKLLLATIGQGFSINKLLHCSLAVAALLERPEPPPGRAPE
jgi:signal transduction histidine kinase/CheY-like chemotaxis protein